MREKKDHGVLIVPNDTTTFSELENHKKKCFNKKKFSFPTLLLCVMAVFPLEMVQNQQSPLINLIKSKGWHNCCLVFGFSNSENVEVALGIHFRNQNFDVLTLTYIFFWNVGKTLES